MEIKINYSSLEKRTRFVGIFFAGVAVATISNYFLGPAFGQAPPTGEQTIGTVYVTLAMAVISLVANLFNGYLAQKAKTVGLNPNSTDERVIRYVLDLAQRFNAAQAQIAQGITFASQIAPDKWKSIVEGTLPAIKAEELSKSIDGANAKVTEGRQLLDAIEDAVQTPKPLPNTEVAKPPVTDVSLKVVPPDTK